jgi:hypothetical protein
MRNNTKSNRLSLLVLTKNVCIIFLIHSQLFLRDSYVHAFSVVNGSSSTGSTGSSTRTIINKAPDLEKQAGHMNTNDNDENNDNDKNNSIQVKVTVENHYPTLSSPKEAQDSWLSFVWNKGGGLPALVIPSDNNDNDKKVNKEEISSNEGDAFIKSPKLKSSSRLLLPLFMKEELITSTYDEDNDESDTSEIELKYVVTDAGLLSSEIVPFTHLGTVTFAPCLEGQGGISITWDVTFDVTESSRRSFWQVFTNQMITDSLNNLSSYVAAPILYTRRTRLTSKPDSTLLTPKVAMEKWIDFCWKDGGGLPLPPTLNYDQDDGKVRWVIPPFLKERIVSYGEVKTENVDSVDVDGHKSYPPCEIIYTVDNPGITTYQVHSHLGRISFVPVFDNNSDNEQNEIGEKSFDSSITSVDMIWEIEIQPYQNWSTFVKLFTSAIVTTYAQNFKCHVYEGSDAMVSLKPPRGEFGGESIMQIRKDSWVGGVLDAHLNDRRSTVEQTISMFQPWTWGRCSDDIGEGEEWKEGRLS